MRNCDQGTIAVHTDFVANQKGKGIGSMTSRASDGNVKLRKEGCCQPEGNDE